MKKILPIIFIFVSYSFFAQDKNVFSVARSGSVEEIKKIFETTPEKINEIDFRGFTPLILACYQNNIAVAEFLIEKSNNIDYLSPEGTALAAVAVKYNSSLVKLLLDRGADPNIKDNEGISPFLWSVKFGNLELVKMFLDHKADPNTKDFEGITAFEYALKTNNKEIINLIKSKINEN